MILEPTTRVILEPIHVAWWRRLARLPAAIVHTVRHVSITRDNISVFVCGVVFPWKRYSPYSDAVEWSWGCGYWVWRCRWLYRGRAPVVPTYELGRPSFRVNRPYDAPERARPTAREAVLHEIGVMAMTAQSDPHAEASAYRRALIDICNIALKAEDDHRG